MNSTLSRLRRRDFLKLAAAGGLALSIPVFGSRLGSRLATSVESQPISTSFNALGTTVIIVIEDEISVEYANQLFNSVSNKISELQTILTRFPGGTDLCNLNQCGKLEDPSPNLVNLLQEATKYSESTEGSFDVTVEPVLNLLQGYLSGQPFPSDSQFDSCLKLINFEKVEVSESLVSFGNQGMGATVDGIGMGYILDKSIDILKSNGIKSAYINFGGTLETIGSRLDGSPWEVGIIDPLNPTKTMGSIYLKDQAVATTGDYEDYFTSNKEYYQIISPFTARSPLFSHSASVVASTALMADPLAVTLMVDDPDAGMNLIDSFPVEGLLYTDNNGVMTTSGMKQLMTG